jgi:tetratricopeptide (TPR) repeat protein
MYYQVNDLQRAHSAFQAAQAADSNWAYPHFGLGCTQLQQAYVTRESKTNYRSSLLKSAMEFELAISLDDRFVEAYVMLAFCYADGGRAEQAIDVALRAFVIAPENGKVRFAAGYSYFAAGRKQFVSARPFLEASLSATKDPLDQTQRELASALLTQVMKRRK